MKIYFVQLSLYIILSPTFHYSLRSIAQHPSREQVIRSDSSDLLIQYSNPRYVRSSNVCIYSSQMRGLLSCVCWIFFHLIKWLPTYTLSLGSHPFQLKQKGKKESPLASHYAVLALAAQCLNLSYATSSRVCGLFFPLV